MSRAASGKRKRGVAPLTESFEPASQHPQHVGHEVVGPLPSLPLASLPTHPTAVHSPSSVAPPVQSLEEGAEVQGLQPPDDTQRTDLEALEASARQEQLEQIQSILLALQERDQYKHMLPQIMQLLSTLQKSLEEQQKNSNEQAHVLCQLLKAQEMNQKASNEQAHVICQLVRYVKFQDEEIKELKQDLARRENLGEYLCHHGPSNPTTIDEHSLIPIEEILNHLP